MTPFSLFEYDSKCAVENFRLRIAQYKFKIKLSYEVNFRESGDTGEIFKFLRFCPNILYCKLLSKNAFKGSAAFYFFRN